MPTWVVGPDRNRWLSQPRPEGANWGTPSCRPTAEQPLGTAPRAAWHPLREVAVDSPIDRNSQLVRQEDELHIVALEQLRDFLHGVAVTPPATERKE